MKHLKKILQKTDPKVILACADICDGHTIFKPEAFTEEGLDESVVDYFCRNHVGGSHYKEQIEDNDGNPVSHTTGVYGLTMLDAFARLLEVEYEPKLGRGSQARSIQKALHEKLEK